MNKWLYTLDLSDIYHSENHNLRSKAEIIANRIERSKFYDKAYSFAINEVVDIMRSLADGQGLATEEPDVEDFDAAMNGLYDYADIERVWVDTFPKPARVATEEEK